MLLSLLLSCTPRFDAEASSGVHAEPSAELAAPEAPPAAAPLEMAPEAPQAEEIADPPTEMAEPTVLEDAPLEVEVPADGMEIRRAKRMTHIYRQPRAAGKERGRLAPGATFGVKGYVDGPGCTGGKWAELAGGGFACVPNSEVSTDPLYLLPRLVEFVHPAPSDWETYSKTGVYDTSTANKVKGLVPYIYAKVWRRWRGPVYSSAEAYGRGAKPVSQLEPGKKLAFVGAVETEKGVVLQRENGTVVPRDEIFLYPVSYFHGRELDKEPVPDGMLAAWVFGYDGAQVRPQPSLKSEPALVLPYHQPLLVKDQPADSTGHWWEIPDALGPGVPGYVHDQRDIRHWSPRDPPAQVGAEELWLDVDLDQQVIALRRGPEELFITLVSTGEAGWETPAGVFRIYDKMIDTNMESRPDAPEEDVYYVEKVPWTMHFKPRYALHGVFWHWGFGHRASHGCINLAPRDARYIFDRVGPTLQAGWHTVFETPEDPGTVVRVREGQAKVADRRAALR